VKNTDTAQEKGYDAGKKISGIKRHIAVDTQGLPHAIHITTANITDRGGALEMFSLHEDVLSDVENVLVDGGYIGDPFANGVEKLLHCRVEVANPHFSQTLVKFIQDVCRDCKTHDEDHILCNMVEECFWLGGCSQIDNDLYSRLFLTWVATEVSG
jgi:transposase